jgi:hypothetical protein
VDESTSPRRRAPLRWALVAFAMWLGSLLAALAVEGTAAGRALFESEGGALAYLVLQGAAYVLALGACSAALVGGTARQRLALSLPTAMLLLYGAIALSGPG